mgnify:CR=1 FL=1
MALNNAQERYTDSRRTRVYQREQEQFIGQTQAIAPKEKLLEGLSIPQVIAGAAAAATSVALASHIGIAGSVIGAAVSSIVTVLSSQIYRHFLSAGAAKLKHEPQRPGPSNAYVSGYGYSERAAQGYYDRQPARYGARIAPTKLQARAAAERAATQGDRLLRTRRRARRRRMRGSHLAIHRWSGPGPAHRYPLARRE